MQKQTTPLAPYGSMNHLALVAKVGSSKAAPTFIIGASRTVVRRAAAQ